MTSKTGSGMAPNVDGRPTPKKIKVMDAKQDKSALRNARSCYERSIAGKSAPSEGTGAMGSGKADTSADR